MSDSSKKQNFLHGAALLAMATAVVKVIGALYKIPLKMIIGDSGFSDFSVAYQIYSVLLMISTAGLPIAMSRMISQADAQGQYGQVRQVFRVSRRIFWWLGIAGSAMMCLLCKPLANVMGYPDAWFAILCLGPCALLMCIMSYYRGFFQGQEDMRPTSNSQMLEAVVKLVIGLAAAFLVLKFTDSQSMAAGGAILGVTVSCLVSVLYLMGKFRPAYQRLPQSREQVWSAGQTTKELLKIAVPITIGSVGLNLLTLLETGVYTNRVVDLVEANRYTLPLVDTLKQELLADGVAAEKLASKVVSNLNGIYSFGQTLFNMPGAFIVPITVSIIPAITAQLTMHNPKEVQNVEESAARITGLMCWPCAVGLALLASPIMSVLGGYRGERNDLATQILMLLGTTVLPYGIILYTNAVLQAHGKAHLPVINMLGCGVAKLVMVYILAGNPYLGILAAPVCTLVCNTAIAALNLFAISRVVPQKPKLVRNLLRPALSAALMGAAVFATYYAMQTWMGIQMSTSVGALLLCGVPVMVGVLVYLVCIVVLRAIRKEDLQLIPKGEKLAKLLHM
ncbi:MAG: polysaccharide biosynthesis protein [Ruminococcaceae bacterium]|nr:polysaccharide biosynthesis protein [Oscillospiraceae bacterium]